MCKFTEFHFLCEGAKLKITSPCESAFTNYQGIQYCRKDPQAHINDGVYRDRSHTHGPGICSNVNCREYHGMLSSKDKASDLIEDDSEFDMSPDACTERENRWYRYLLSTDQQLECINTVFPVPLESMSDYGRVYLWLGYLSVNERAAHFDETSNASPDAVTWQELNPKYMSQDTLQLATAYPFLPIWVTDTRQAVPDRFSNKKSKGSKKGKSASKQTRTTTPKMPLYGPFQIPSHRCNPVIGFCETCGHYRGKLRPCHGNDLHRKMIQVMSRTNDGLLPDDFFRLPENANQGIVPSPPSDEQQTSMDGMLPDVDLSVQEAQNFDAGMFDWSTFPLCDDMDASTDGLDVDQLIQDSQALAPKTPATSSSDFLGMASVEQFNGSYGDDAFPAPNLSNETQQGGDEQLFDFGKPNAAGELMDVMQH